MRHPVGAHHTERPAILHPHPVLQPRETARHWPLSCSRSDRRRADRHRAGALTKDGVASPTRVRPRSQRWPCPTARGATADWLQTADGLARRTGAGTGGRGRHCACECVQTAHPSSKGQVKQRHAASSPQYDVSVSMHRCRRARCVSTGSCRTVQCSRRTSRRRGYGGHVQ